MALTKDIYRRLEVPGEDGAWIQIRMLSWLRLDEARRKRLAAIADLARSLSGIDFSQANGATRPVADRLTEYDTLTLLRGGLVAWSYGETVEPEELDEPTALWLAREILDYALPTEAQVKERASRSTAT